jgi:hypothetical protein
MRSVHWSLRTEAEILSSRDYLAAGDWWNHHIQGNWFKSDLLKLIAKADLTNREKLRIAFPIEVGLYELWYYQPLTEDEG